MSEQIKENIIAQRKLNLEKIKNESLQSGKASFGHQVNITKDGITTDAAPAHRSMAETRMFNDEEWKSNITALEELKEFNPGKTKLIDGAINTINDILDNRAKSRDIIAAINTPKTENEPLNDAITKVIQEKPVQMVISEEHINYKE